MYVLFIIYVCASIINIHIHIMHAHVQLAAIYESHPLPISTQYITHIIHVQISIHRHTYIDTTHMYTYFMYILSEMDKPHALPISAQLHTWCLWLAGALQTSKGRPPELYHGQHGPLPHTQYI